MNPFERYDLDPSEGPQAITERLRELIEDAPNEAERDALRAAWEQLTRHARDRVRLALLAHPETRTPLPALSITLSGLAGKAGTAAGSGVPEDDDFIDPPSVEAAFLSSLSVTERSHMPPLAEALSPPLDLDPILTNPSPKEGSA